MLHSILQYDYICMKWRASAIVGLSTVDKVSDLRKQIGLIFRLSLG